MHIKGAIQLHVYNAEKSAINVRFLKMDRIYSSLNELFQATLCTSDFASHLAYFPGLAISEQVFLLMQQLNTHIAQRSYKVGLRYEPKVLD